MLLLFHSENLKKFSSTPGNTMLSNSEKELDMLVKWLTLDEALNVLICSVNSCDDYSTKFVMLRNQTILEYAVSLL